MGTVSAFWHGTNWNRTFLDTLAHVCFGPDSVAKPPVFLWCKNFGLIERVLEFLAEGVANF
jgi:hypothetical protein